MTFCDYVLSASLAIYTKLQMAKASTCYVLDMFTVLKEIKKKKKEHYAERKRAKVV